ncbi:MAG: B12-binding domain-containing radical SAM protein [Lachnospiraceae bacterium]|nr:B12-binding domain-containing radical SAM protein [Lachnospiraceae bacterium]
MALDLLLIRPNDQKKVYSAVTEFTAVEPPFWAASIAAYVRDKGIRVEILDAEAENIPPEDVVIQIKKKNPKLIGLIITGNHLSASTWKMHGAGILAKTIKESSIESPIFMWGLHVSALPEQTLQEEKADYVIKGEGLRSIVQLTEFAARQIGDPDSILGLYYRKKNGTIAGNPCIALEEDLDNIPMQAFDLLCMDKYRAHNWQRFGEKKDSPKGYGVIATTLGCPFCCTYCAISTLFGMRKVRYRSIDRVIQEIEILVQKYGVHYIKILDENFVLNKEYVTEICDRLIEKNFDLNIWAYARVDTLDETILKKLRQANVKWLCLGIESADENSMADVKKAQYGNAQTRKIIEKIKEADIHILANIMFGLPKENKSSMEKTLAFARELNCEWINMYATMAFPGSQLYEEQVMMGGRDLPESWLGYSELSYESKPMPTQYLTSKEVLAFRDYAFQAFFADNKAYFDMMDKKFGAETVAGIKNMLKRKMRRKLLEE